MNSAETQSDELEAETCSRCCGTGKHSHCVQFGDRCFRCGGKGRTLTRRGAAASRYLERLRSKPASELIPGVDIIYARGHGITPSGWSLVTSVEPSTHRGRYMMGGVWYEVTDTVDVLTDKPGHGLCNCKPDTLFRVRQTPEQAAETWAKAIEYQGTLTKAGKPRTRWVTATATKILPSLVIN